MKALTPFFIVSGALAHLTPGANEVRTNALANALRQFGFALERVNGCYTGQTEPSLLAFPFIGQGLSAEADLLRLARDFDQESVLAVDGTRRAALVYTADGSREPLGDFKHVTEAEALKHGAYTVHHGQYFVCSGAQS